MSVINNIFRKEMRWNRSSFIGWSVSISIFIFLGMAFYPVLMQGDMLKQIEVMFENPFMKNILSAFGASIDVLSSPLGFYSTRNAIFVMLLGSFFSILLAGKILAQEERDKTAEFLLTKPVNRIEIVGSKLVAFFTYLVALNVIILGVGYSSLEMFKGEKSFRLVDFLIHSFYSFLLMLLFGAIGFFISLLKKRGRPITNLSIGIIVGAYFIDALSKITPSVDKLGYISPFKFVDSSVLNPEYNLVWWRAGYFLGLSLLLFALSFVIYRRKDISI